MFDGGLAMGRGEGFGLFIFKKIYNWRTTG